MVENLPVISGEAEAQVWSLGQEDPQRRKWKPTPVLLSGNPMDRGAWQATVHGVTKSWNNWVMERARAHTHTHTHTHTDHLTFCWGWDPEVQKGEGLVKMWVRADLGQTPEALPWETYVAPHSLPWTHHCSVESMSRMIPWLLKVKMPGRDARPGIVMLTQGWKQGVDLWLQEREQKANARQVRSPYGEMWQ